MLAHAPLRVPCRSRVVLPRGGFVLVYLALQLGPLGVGHRVGFGHRFIFCCVDAERADGDVDCAVGVVRDRPEREDRVDGVDHAHRVGAVAAVAPSGFRVDLACFDGDAVDGVDDRFDVIVGCRVFDGPRRDLDERVEEYFVISVATLGHQRTMLDTLHNVPFGSSITSVERDTAEPSHRTITTSLTRKVR